MKVFKVPVVLPGMTIVLLAIGSVFAVPLRPSGPVADYAGIIDQETRLKVSSAARSLWSDFRVGLVVATVESAGDLSLDRYTGTLATAWGVGIDSSHAALLVVVGKEPADVCILWRKQGLPPDEPSDIARFALLSGCTEIRNGDFSTGVLVLTAELTRAMKNELTGERAEIVADHLRSAGPVTTGRLLFLIVAIVPVVLVLRKKMAGLNRGVSGKGDGGFHCRYSNGPFLAGRDTR